MYKRQIENKCKEELKNYRGDHYTLHLANSDEVLSFDELTAYMNENKVKHKLYNYDTDHRFGTVVELLENIKSELIQS